MTFSLFPEEPARRPCEAARGNAPRPGAQSARPRLASDLQGWAFRFPGLRGFMLRGFRETMFSFAEEPAPRPRETYRKRSVGRAQPRLASDFGISGPQGFGVTGVPAFPRPGSLFRQKRTLAAPTSCRAA